MPTQISTLAIMPRPETSTTGLAPDEFPAPAGQPLLQARKLGFTVDGRTLWRNLDLTLLAGERLAIAGPSGSGKTLLLRTLAGLEQMQTGELVFRGKPLSNWSMPSYRAHVSYVSQRPALPEGRVETILQAPFRFHVHQLQRFPADRTLELLQIMGRDEDFLQQRTDRLSGGEAQIVAMVRALLVAPDVLLLDEPTASLDATAVASIESLVANWLQQQPQRACVWTSHDRGQLERISDRVLSLEPIA